MGTAGSWVELTATQLSPWGISPWFSYWLCMLLGMLGQKGLPPWLPCLLLPFGLCWTRLEDVSYILTPINGQGDGLGVQKVAISLRSLISSYMCVCAHTCTCSWNTSIDLLCMKGVDACSPKTCRKTTQPCKQENRETLSVNKKHSYLEVPICGLDFRKIWQVQWLETPTGIFLSSNILFFF